MQDRRLAKIHSGQVGGFVEDGSRYFSQRERSRTAPSRRLGTAWALLGLTGRGNDDLAETRGPYLLTAQEGDGSWQEEHFTGTGFLRMFDLHCHNCAIFYRTSVAARPRRPMHANPNTPPTVTQTAASSLPSPA
ncbi:hypothetical protein [uncultured Methylovirgula sp.]|uniref:hypothetical protein n=1 Tax=uncultured Methylovirgula sp. TaxID=1285960 RepID=UPI00261BF76C|nr:hypothetical protein [uncultured Methylovirgula sp.]